MIGIILGSKLQRQMSQNQITYLNKIIMPLNTTIHSFEMRAETQKEGEGLERLRTGK